MRLHPNAKLTPKTRRLLVDRVRREHWSVSEAARAAGVTRRTAYKWLKRFEEGGEAALQDRSSRPHRIPRQTPRRAIRRMEQLRRRKKTAWEIALETGIPAATVSRQLQQLGLGRLWRLEEELDPPQRYEHPIPGELFHIDAKKLARIEAIAQPKVSAGFDAIADHRALSIFASRLSPRPDKTGTPTELVGAPSFACLRI